VKANALFFRKKATQMECSWETNLSLAAKESKSFNVHSLRVLNHYAPHRRKRRGDTPLFVTTLLKPFLPVNIDCGNELADKDIDAGLYNFLSPPLETLNAGGGGAGCQPGESTLSAQYSTIPRPPEWYQRGHNVQKLLQGTAISQFPIFYNQPAIISSSDAEGLDWMEDSGGFSTEPRNKPSTMIFKEEASYGKDPKQADVKTEKNNAYDISCIFYA